MKTGSFRGVHSKENRATNMNPNEHLQKRQIWIKERTFDAAHRDTWFATNDDPRVHLWNSQKMMQIHPLNRNRPRSQLHQGCTHMNQRFRGEQQFTNMRTREKYTRQENLQGEPCSTGKMRHCETIHLRRRIGHRNNHDWVENQFNDSRNAAVNGCLQLKHPNSMSHNKNNWIK